MRGIVPAHPIDLVDLTGRKIALDAYNAMYQFMAKIRQPDGSPLMTTWGEITSVHSGIFYRTANLLAIGMIPVYVFDGEPPAFKSATIAEREERRREARELWLEAREAGNLEEARKYAQQAGWLTEDMVADAKEILRLMGVPVVQAPSEGEAQAAHMADRGDVWAAGSQDYDSLLFGAPRLVRNLTLSGRRKLPGRKEYAEISPEVIELGEVLSSLGITREQLVVVGLLVGTDYNPGGIKGIGPKRAVQLVKRAGTLEGVLREVGWPFDVDPTELLEFFLNPPVTDDYEVGLSPPSEEDLLKFMVEGHQFSESRVSKTLAMVREAYKRLRSAGGLEEWL